MREEEKERKREGGRRKKGGAKGRGDKGAEGSSYLPRTFFLLLRGALETGQSLAGGSPQLI